MKALDDAWRWYENTRDNLLRLNRLARKYWLSLPWEGALGRDDEFRLLVDGAISQVYRSGEIEKLYVKYFGEPDESALTFFRWNTLPE